jgi:putative transposase
MKETGAMRFPFYFSPQIMLEFTRHPFYGSRRMVVIPKRQGWVVNRKHVQRLMRMLGLAGMAPGPGTAVQHPGHKVYPYLLRGVAIVRPNHVWSTVRQKLS